MNNAQTEHYLSVIRSAEIGLKRARAALVDAIDRAEELGDVYARRTFKPDLASIDHHLGVCYYALKREEDNGDGAA